MWPQARGTCKAITSSTRLEESRLFSALCLSMLEVEGIKKLQECEVLATRSVLCMLSTMSVRIFLSISFDCHLSVNLDNLRYFNR